MNLNINLIILTKMSTTSFDGYEINSHDYNHDAVVLNEKIGLVDSTEDASLRLYCYKNCSNDDTTFVKNCRGLIYDTNNNLVVKGLPFTDEYVSDQKLETVINNLSNYSFFEAHEGALVRMFYFNDKWYVSTHRKLDAYRSKWSSPYSFGQMFKKGIEHDLNKTMPEFESILLKDHVYLFLIRNDKFTRIVCHPPNPDQPYIYHIGSICAGKLWLNNSIGLAKPTTLSFNNLEQLVEYVNTIDPYKLQGVIGINQTNSSTIKIVNTTYNKLFKVRGNEPSKKFRYLQVRMDRELVQHLYQLYPEMATIFDDYESVIKKISAVIFTGYVNKFMKGNRTVVPKDEFRIMSMCHEWHKLDRHNNRVTQERVINVLNKQTPVFLNHIIKRYNSEKLTKENPRSYESSPALNAIKPELPPPPQL